MSQISIYNQTNFTLGDEDAKGKAFHDSIKCAATGIILFGTDY